MENAPITGLAELDAHLDQLVEDPALPLNAKLIDDVELQLTGMPTWAQPGGPPSSLLSCYANEKH